jgi:hypothetical protein
MNLLNERRAKIMKKLLFLLIALTGFSSVSFAQQPLIISQISKCLLNNPADQEENCFRGYISPSIEISDIIGNWLVLDEKGNDLDSNDRGTVISIEEVSQPFPIGCTVIMAFGKSNAIKSKTCAPNPDGESLVPQIQSLGKYTYKLTEPGKIELQQADLQKNRENTASCSLVGLSGTNYLVCSVVEIDENVKMIVSFKKNS